MSAGNGSPQGGASASPSGAERDGFASSRAARNYAALDLGTNNCRLLIAQPAQHGFRVVDAFSRIVRLGEGLHGSGRLGEAAMDRALEALAACAGKMKARGVSRSRLVTTEACRAAANGREFVQRVAAQTGLQLEIVDQRTEASLAVTGCASLASPEAEGVIVFDIGGGSTEIIWLGGAGGGAQPLRAHPGLGVRAARRGDAGRAPRRRRGQPELFETMVLQSMEALSKFHARARHVLTRRGFHLLGTSGTVTTVAGLHLKLERYDRRKVDGMWMRSQDVTTVIDDLLSMSFEQRAANACIGTERADLVLAGCAIFEAIRRLFPSPMIRIADRGLREGILLKMMWEDGVWRRRRPS